MEGNVFKYNDYELLYLVSVGEELALDILFEKYGYMIRARAHELNVPKYQFDDYVQEGNLMLLKAINIYNEESKMSFCNFFDLILVRRFYTLLKKDYNENICMRNFDFDRLAEEVSASSGILAEDIDLSRLSEFEKQVFQLFFIEGAKIKQIAEHLNVDSKTVSNAKQRVVKKIKRKVKSI